MEARNVIGDWLMLTDTLSACWGGATTTDSYAPEITSRESAS